MRKIFLIILGIYCHLLWGQQYFQQGTVWKTLWTDSSTGSFTGSVTSYYLEGTEIIDDVEAIGLYMVDSDAVNPLQIPQKIALIREENGKVYFYNIHHPSGGWYILYDFTLEVGQYAEIYDIPYGYSNHLPVKAKVKCIEKEKLEGYENLECMTVFDVSCPYEELEQRYKNKWIVGISSLKGLTSNIWFNMLGGGCSLQEVTYKGEILYSNNKSGIKRIEENNFHYIQEGDNIVIKGALPNSTIQLFSLNGTIVKSFEVNSDGISIISELPIGIYLLRHNNSIIKLLKR